MSGEWSLTRTVAPAVEPMTVGDLKAHLRVDEIDEEDLIAGYLAAARDWAEQFTRRSFMPQTWRLRMNQWPTGNAIQLPRPPITAVSSVTYKDTKGVTQTWASSNYIVGLDHEPGILAKALNIEWPSLYGELDDIAITYTAGYASAAAVPDLIKKAIKLIAKEMFDVRGQTVEGTRSGNVMAAQALLTPYRVHWI